MIMAAAHHAGNQGNGNGILGLVAVLLIARVWLGVKSKGKGKTKK